MARNPQEAALALHRFGFGPRAGSIEEIADDPRGAVIAELDRPGAGQITNPDRPTSGAANRAVFEYRAEQNAEKKRAKRDAAQAAMEAAPAQPEAVPLPRQLFRNEARARIDAALDAEIGLVERLVWFWSNHFCVNQDKTVMAGAYEREAIRPHVLGRFADMLLAAESHPAMLLYLDNARSIGPDSIAGLRQKRGLNENLAREILELHTLGVRTVYTQEDVTRFANVITGWTFVPFRQDPVRGGEFEFNPRMHQPGAQTVIGRSYADAGVQQGRDVLAVLARHPATAKHVAAKLARHFVADEPPPALVERLAKRFLATQGDLKEIAKTLVTAPEAWEAPRAKLKRPGEWVVGMLRAAGITPPDIGPVMQAHNLLGEPLWRPSAPKGFADESAPWLDGLAQRLDIANQFARRFGAEADPREVFEQALAPLASARTRPAVLRAESRPQAFALLFMAPEFQRR